MLISSVQSSSSLLSGLSSSSLSTSSTNSSTNAFATALANLFSSIQSGDTTNAEKYLSQVQQLTPSNADSSSPLGTFLSSVSSALDSNNISAAQTALTTLEGQFTTATTDTSSNSSSTNNTVSAFAQDMVSLFSSISSGDLAGAQSAYDNLTSLLLGSSSSTSSTSGATDTSSSTSSSSSTDSSFTSLLQKIGSALSSGDINSAQTALDSFLQSLASGSLVSTTA